MKLKFTRKTWYFFLLAAAAVSMLGGFAVLGGMDFSALELVAFCLTGIAALFLAAQKGAPAAEKRNYTLVFVLLMLSKLAAGGWAGDLCSALVWPALLGIEYSRGKPIQRQLQLVCAAEVLRTVFGIGAPAGLESMMFNSGKLVVQVILSGLGTLTISANQIASSVQSLFMIPHNVMQYMAIPIMAATAAQGVRQKTADCMRYLYRVTLIWSVAVGLVTFPLAAPLCRIFTREAEILSVSVRLLWMSACFAPFWPAAFLIPSAFRGAGDVRVSLLWGTFTMWTCRVVLAYLLGVCLSMGVYGVWLGVYADWLLRGAVFLYRSRSGVWILPKTSGKKGTKTQHQKAEIR